MITASAKASCCGTPSSEIELSDARAAAASDSEDGRGRLHRSAARFAGCLSPASRLRKRLSSATVVFTRDFASMRSVWIRATSCISSASRHSHAATDDIRARSGAVDSSKNGCNLDMITVVEECVQTRRVIRTLTLTVTPQLIIEIHL